MIFFTICRNLENKQESDIKTKFCQNNDKNIDCKKNYRK